MPLSIPQVLQGNLVDMRRALYFGYWGGAGAVAGTFIGEVIGLQGREAQRITFLELLTQVGFWFAIIGLCVAAGVSLALQTYGKKSLFTVLASVAGYRVVVGAIFGGISGFFAGAIAQALYTSIGPTELLRVICWGIAGGLLGIALGFRIPNLTRLRGFAGGAIGGLFGGVLFIVLAFLGTQVIGRLLGVGLIGFAIGMMIMLVDAIFREAWLEIRYGPREVRSLTLGREPLLIGGDASKCDLYVRDVQDIACIFRLENNQVWCDDHMHHRSGPVQAGIPMVIGNVTVTPFKCGISHTVADLARGHTDPEINMLVLANGREIPLLNGVRLAKGEILGLEPNYGNNLIAEVTRHPTEPTMLGLKNLSGRQWRATYPGRRLVEVGSGQSVRLEPGLKIDFGLAEGRIGRSIAKHA